LDNSIIDTAYDAEYYDEYSIDDEHEYKYDDLIESLESLDDE